jgi:hypothetical protein
MNSFEMQQMINTENCFQGWSGKEDLQAPSPPMYGIWLFPLLHLVEDVSMAKAATQVYAYAMRKHPLSRANYQDANVYWQLLPYPVRGDDGKQKSVIPFPQDPEKVIPTLVKKKPISTGLPKKKSNNDNRPFSHNDRER